MIPDAINIGDVFEDGDRRMMRCSIVDYSQAHMRRVEVIGVEVIPGRPVRAIVRDVTTGLRTKIAHWRLLKGGSRGFRRVVDE